MICNEKKFAMINKKTNSSYTNMICNCYHEPKNSSYKSFTFVDYSTKANNNLGYKYMDI